MKNLLKHDDTKKGYSRRDLTENEHYADWIETDIEPLRCFCEFRDWGGDVMKIVM